jgi:hypothetical protein
MCLAKRNDILPHNFSLADLLAALLAFVLFGLFALIPGWVVAWAVNLLGFRRRTPLARFAIAVPLSIGVAPALAFLAGRLLSFPAIWFVFGLLWLSFPVICFRELRAGDRRAWLPPRSPRYAAIAGFWLALGLVSLIDLQIGDRLYFSVVSFDYALRSTFVSSISRTGIPPANPLFFPGHAVPLRYHYFWLILCSLVNLLGGSLVSARQAIIGGTLWCGLGLMAIVAVFLRFVHPTAGAGIHRRSMVGIGLLCVTGLDILPNLLLDYLHHPKPDPEWWNEQVSSWITSVLWVPHHTVALIAGLAGALIIWNSILATERWQRTSWAVVGGLCLATCIGSSVYVALVFAVGLSVWTCILLMKRAWREVFFAAGAGLVAVCAAAPHLLSLMRPVSAQSGALPIIFRVRPFLPEWAFHAQAFGSAHRENLLNALLLPLNYFLELGAFLVAGIWMLWRWHKGPKALSRYRLFTLALAGASIVICTFFRSDVIQNNDLGWRGFLLCQFVLLLWTVDLLEQVPASRRLFLNVLLAIGVASSVYEVATLRLFNLALDRMDIPRQEWSLDHNLGKRTYALRTGYEALRRELPAGAIVQHNPIATPEDLPYGLYADRPVAADSPECGVAFGGDPASCAVVSSALSRIFSGAESAPGLDRVCTGLSISAVLVKDTDPAWHSQEDWLWQRRPIVANGYMRVVPCGNGQILLSRYTTAP